MLTDHTFEARDGTTLHIHSLLADSPVAVLLFVHGLGEHIGRYDELFRSFREKQVSCIGFDLRGHGKSSGKRGHAGSYDHLLDDIGELLQWIKNSNTEIPLFLYGHSMGGNLVLNFLLRRNPENVRGGIVTSPWLRLKVKPSMLKTALAAVMHRLYPAWSEGNALDPADLSRDPEVGKAYANDPLVHDQISAGLFTDMMRAGRWALDHADQLKIPVLLLHGEADPITSPDASHELAKGNPEQIEFRLFPGMRHETHHETGREEVFQTQWQWLASRL